jgi:hypothetical protein
MRNVDGGASRARRRGCTGWLGEPGTVWLRPRTTRPNISLGAADRQYGTAADWQHAASCWWIVNAQQHNAGIEPDRPECDESE